MSQNSKVETLPGVDVELDVIARVAAKAALEVKGALALENAFADDIAAAIGRDGRARGVRVVSEKNGCGLHIGVVTEYGLAVPEIAWNIQEHVKKTVERLIGVRVLKVDVNIAGIRDISGRAGLKS
jgi:uncharacterized alkaline shock family protein YloU